MKILTICHAGAVRSVTLAWVLRSKYKQDALPMSVNRNSESTRKMLYEWADKIFIAEESMEGDIPIEYMDKIVPGPYIGEDVWKQSLVPDLVTRCIQVIEESKIL